MTGSWDDDGNFDHEVHFEAIHREKAAATARRAGILRSMEVEGLSSLVSEGVPEESM
ncbi:hypothetical protein AB4Z38_09155 [Arthrobacter sp. 2RAF6]|uniref:hypothetical protein n=1 Tax=Arthrobacter sp. 2RAF6 TaxID=3233002 RepID=UPI003F8FE05C